MPSSRRMAYGAVVPLFLLLAALVFASFRYSDDVATPRGTREPSPPPPLVVILKPRIAIATFVAVSPPPPLPLPYPSAVIWHTHYVTFNPLYSFYGITNQLICYAAALAYGLQSKRNVLFPVDMPGTFYELFDAAETQRRLPPGATIAYTANVTELGKPISMNKKSLFLPERDFYRSPRASEVRWKMTTMFSRSKKYNYVRHHNFFMRFPWLPSDYPNDEARLFRAIVPCLTVRNYADALMKFLGNATLAIHLRIEADSHLIRTQGARNPSPDQLKKFLYTEAFLLAKREGFNTVYICMGRVPDEYLRVLQDLSSHGGVRFLHKHEVSLAQALPSMPRLVGVQRDERQKTQDHYTSLADLVVLSRVRRAYATYHSSMRYAILAWRCGGDTTRSLDDGVYTIAIKNDGGIGSPVFFPCRGVSKGWVGHDDPAWV